MPFIHPAVWKPGCVTEGLDLRPIIIQCIPFGSLETRLCNGGVGSPPHHNTMLSISYLFFPNLMCWSDAILSCLLVIDSGRARRQERSRQRIQSWLHDRIEVTIDDLDQEADRLADRLEEHMKDKRKRDFRKQKAAKSKPGGPLGGRHWQQHITGDSFTLCGSKCPPAPPLRRSSQAHPTGSASQFSFLLPWSLQAFGIGGKLATFTDSDCIFLGSVVHLTACVA